MLHTIAFSDEITVWWEKEWDIPDGAVYRLRLDGEVAGETDKTHFTFAGVKPDSCRRVTLERKTAGGFVRLAEAEVNVPREKKRLDVTKAPYFAKGDGVAKDTEAIRRALADCDCDACVYFPRGTYLTGSLDVHSHTEIYLDEGATIAGSTDPNDYLPKRRNRFEGIEADSYSALITAGAIDNASGCTTEDVVIRGKGSIVGGGVTLARAVIDSERERLKDFLEANAEYVKTCENEDTIPGRARPDLICFYNCRGAVVAGITFGYGAAWNAHFVYCKDVTTFGCSIKSPGVWNGDGWDPDSSENCTIFDCDFETGDDSIAIKSGKNPEGNVIARPCKEVRIFDCRGGRSVSLGSEMSGGVENVYVWDCRMDFGLGLGIKVTEKRGGYVRNVRVRNCEFPMIRMRSVRFNNDGESAPQKPVMENITLENLVITGRNSNGDVYDTSIHIVGVDGDEHSFKNVVFDGLRLLASGGAPCIMRINNVKGLTLKNVSVS